MISLRWKFKFRCLVKTSGSYIEVKKSKIFLFETTDSLKYPPLAQFNKTRRGSFRFNERQAEVCGKNCLLFFFIFF